MKKIKGMWRNFKAKHIVLVEFIVFLIISIGVTLLQLVLMPLIKYLFEFTQLMQINFQIFQVGKNINGSLYYVFDYASGSISNGGGGGLAYFLAVEITLLIAQVINFFLQRKVTFKSNSSILKAAFWYFAAYVMISIVAAALQGFYKAPIYSLLINGLGKTAGTTLADIITMLINSTVSFIVFFPIFKVIFKKKNPE